MKKLISNIKIEGKYLSEKTQEELFFSIEKIKKRARNGESLDNILVEWFALVQEISFREIGLKHFDTQLLAGYFLHQGKIVEMQTGEGKTLASTLSVSLNALENKGVHVVTVNDYLAERDQKLMGKIYSSLGLSSGLIKSTSNFKEKKNSYHCDITYLTNSDVVFDYLRDSSAYYNNEIVQRSFHYCVIDEIDSILIDEARTPLILSTMEEKMNINKLYLAEIIANILEPEKDFQVDEKKKEINLTEKGYQKTKEKLGQKTLYDSSDPWMLEILNALKAKHIFKLNKDYIVLKNRVLIIDEFTGRIMEDRRWALGVHEAIEIKEKVRLNSGSKTKSSITYQNFFPLYPKLSGMTGTAKTAEKEFEDIYNLKVVVIPTSKPMVRKDLSDLVYPTELAKWKAVFAMAKNCFEKGQPLLIGTVSVEKSEFLSDLFSLSKLPHQVLNAKPENITRESDIIAQAGKLKAITIATNMAGRGTDIILGGNPQFLVKQKIEEFLFKKKIPFSKNLQNLENLRNSIFHQYAQEKNFSILEKEVTTLPFSLDTSLSSLKELYNSYYKEIYSLWEKENKQVKELGGLFILGTERHETRRIDNQLRGRSGRQGDPGFSQFYLSIEDELIKVFEGENIKKWIEYLGDKKEVPLESNLLTKSLENAQQKVESYHYESRKNVFEYDEILNNQRKQLFEARKELLKKHFFNDFLLKYGESFLDEILEKKKKKKMKSFSFLEKRLDFYSFYEKQNETQKIKKKKYFLYEEFWVSFDFRLAESNAYQLGFLKKNRLTLLLSIIDFYWTQHLERINYIRDTINWRAYGQQNPLIEYNFQAFESFHSMFKQIRSCMLYYSFNHII